MRFMVLVKADKNTEAGALPDEKLLTEMGKFNEELAKAGVLLAGEGLHPSSKGARVHFSGVEEDGDRWSFCRDKRARRGILAVEREIEGRGNRVGEALPQSHGNGSRNRDSPGIRGRGLWTSVHTRTQGAGSTTARAGRSQKVANPDRGTRRGCP